VDATKSDEVAKLLAKARKTCIEFDFIDACIQSLKSDKGRDMVKAKMNLTIGMMEKAEIPGGMSIHPPLWSFVTLVLKGDRLQ